jgi:hypothetical protein
MSGRKERMDTRTVLIVTGGSLLVIIVGLVLLFRSRATRKLNRSVLATVTHIQVEASSLSSWWVVTAQWTDSQTGQTLIFRSRHLQFPPKQHVGDGVAVRVNASKPTRYRMEL